MGIEWVKDKSLAGLYKRASRDKPTWAIKARQRGTNKVVTVTLGRCDLMNVTEARLRAKPVLLALSQGVHPNDESRKARESQQAELLINRARSLTLGKAIEKYLSYRDYKPNTLKDLMQSTTRNFGDWLKRPLREITREDVLERFQAIKKGVVSRRKEVNERNKKLGLPPSRFTSSDGAGEAQRAFRYLTAIFNSFMDDSVGGKPLLDNNPCKILKDKKVRKVLRPREKYLTDQELEAVMDAISSVGHPEYKGSVKPEDADFLMLLMFTGLRVDEARCLLWRNVNLKTKLFSVENTKNHKTHTLPMTVSLETLFRRRRKALKLNATYVFPSPSDDGKPASMSRTFDRVCFEAGVNFTPHDLRRTFATVASEMGVDVHRIAATLNHRKQGVTAGYIQTTVTMLRNTLEVIEQSILKPETVPEFEDVG